MEDKRIYTVYMYKNKVNDKKYVGITSNVKQRCKRSAYKGCLKFQRAIEKYGWDNFEHEIVLCNLIKSEAEMFEVEMIKFYKTTNGKFGYNIQNGGSAPGKMSQESKDKLSKSKIGTKLSDETKKKLSKAFKGRIKSEEHKLKIKLSNIGKNSGKIAHNRRKVICIETKKLYACVSEAAKNTKATVGGINAVLGGRNATSGNLHWMHYDAYLKDGFVGELTYDTIHCKKKVICLENEQVYDKIKDAADMLGLDHKMVSHNVRGICLSVKGYHFAYYDEWINNKNKKYYIRNKKDNSKKVLCIELNKYFDSAKKAKEFIIIGDVYHAIKHNKTAGGYHWKYVD